jgi:soluble lytic murein transglycosylase
VRRAFLAIAAIAAIAAVAIALGAGDLRNRWDRLWHPLSYAEIVRGHAAHYRLDPALLAAVIYQESKFKPDARSDRGAIGLMQLLPGTAKGIALRTGGTAFRVADLYNPEINVRYGSWYLRHLLDKYGGNERLALAAYNAGQTNVDGWLDRGVGIQFSETRSFVDHVEQLKVIYRDTYGDKLIPAGPA